MADLERVIKILFEGDDRSQSAFSSVTGAVGDFGNSVEAVAGKVAGVTDSVLKIDAALLALAIGGLAISISKTSEFSQATSEVGTLISDVTFDMGAYRNEILNYASSSTQSISDITSALYSAISAGSSWEDSIRAVAVAEQLAVAGKADLRDSTVLLLSTLNAYGAGMDEAGRYSDVFFQTVKLGQTTIPELSASLSQVTGIAAGAGIPIETLSAALADLTAKGDPTSMAITGLRAAIQSIIKPVGDAEAIAKSLGIEFNATALQSKGFEGVLLDVWRATGGNIETLSKMFTSVEGLKTVLQLFGRDGGDAFISKLDQMKDATGSVEVAFEKMVAELSLQSQTLANNIDGTFIRIGERILNDGINIVQALTEVFRGLNIGIDAGAFDDVFIVLNEFGATLSNYIEDIGHALPDALAMTDFSGFAGALKELEQAFGGFLGGLDLTKPEDLAQALQTVAQIMTGLIQVTASMVEAFKPYIQKVTEFFIAIANGDKDTQEFAGKLLAHAKIIAEAGWQVALALQAMEATGTSWAGTFETLAAAGSYAWNAWAIAIKEGMLVIIDVAWGINDILDRLTFGQIEYFGQSKEYLESLGDGLRESVAANWKSAEEAFNTLFDTTKNWVAEALGATDQAGKLGTALGGAGEQAEGAAGAVDGLNKSVSEMESDVSFQMSIGGVEGVLEMIRQAGWELDQIPPETITKLAASPDAASFYETWQELEMAFEDVTDVSVVASPDSNSVASTADYLDLWLAKDRDTRAHAAPDAPSVASTTNALDTMAADRAVKVDVDAGDVEFQLERMKQQFSLMQSSVEWKAKLDIAGVEANAQIMSAAFATLATGLQSSADVISAAFGAMSAFSGSINQSIFTDRAFDVIDREMALRERMIDTTNRLVDAQIRYMNAKIAQMNRGDALIQVDGAGLQPHLEAFMWEILSAIQLRVNEEGHAMLFGI